MKQVTMALLIGLLFPLAAPAQQDTGGTQPAAVAGQATGGGAEPDKDQGSRQDEDPNLQAVELAAQEQAIRQTVERYVAAFNKGDVQQLAATWSPEAVYINRGTGEQVTGRAAIAEQYAALFQDQPQLKMEVRVDSVRFVSPNVAVEHGLATLLRPEQEPEQINYRAVYVRRDGQWLLDRVTDDPVVVIPSHYEQLKELEWLVGNWVDVDENVTIVTEVGWTRNRNFLTRSFTMSVDGQIDMAGMQIIGWDPADKTIRSWTFDSDGGFAQGTWKRKDDRWTIKRTGVTADGRRVAEVNILTRRDNDSLTYRSVSRSVDGEILPDIDEIRIQRQAD